MRLAGVASINCLSKLKLKKIYEKPKETIERVYADAKESGKLI